MSYLAEGDYFESCNCLITYRCTFGATFGTDRNSFITEFKYEGQK